MPTRNKLSRRKFLKMLGMAASTATLGACTSPIPTGVETTIAPFPTTTPFQSTPTPTKEPVKAIIPEMVLVEAGNFQMGSPDGRSDEQPVHTVHLTRPFYIGQYAVTFAEYDRFCADTHQGKPDDRGWGRENIPVINVDWYEVVAYCNWLSEKEGLPPCYSGKGKVTRCDFSASGYRLPTELAVEQKARGTLTPAATIQTKWPGIVKIQTANFIQLGKNSQTSWVCMI